MEWLLAFVASMSDPISLTLLLGGFVIGILSVIFGGGMFFSVPLMQWLFPGITLGAVIGNVKVGSFFRSIGSTWATHEHIEYWRNVQISILAFVGTILGALLISKLDQSWLLPAAILAVIIAESAPRIAHLITGRTYHLASFLTGIYAGTFSAGIGIVLVALLRLKHPSDTDIAHVKIQARFVELLLIISAVVTHWFTGNLIAAIWIPWSIGSIIGGAVGGVLLRHMIKLSAAWQRAVLRISYAITIITAAIRF